jgi:hypothetical protein
VIHQNDPRSFDRRLPLVVRLLQGHDKQFYRIRPVTAATPTGSTADDHLWANPLEKQPFVRHSSGDHLWASMGRPKRSPSEGDPLTHTSKKLAVSDLYGIF